MELSKPLLSNSGLKAIPALRELMLYSVMGEWKFHFLKACQYQQWEQPGDTGDS
jgi:hypothetical protein